LHFPETIKHHKLPGTILFVAEAKQLCHYSGHNSPNDLVGPMPNGAWAL
jgi:hypothetical protein